MADFKQGGIISNKKIVSGGEKIITDSMKVPSNMLLERFTAMELGGRVTSHKLKTEMSTVFKKFFDNLK